MILILLCECKVIFNINRWAYEKKKIGLLPKIVIAIALGIACGLFFPDWLVRIFLTMNGLFSNFLGFIIPLLILRIGGSGYCRFGQKGPGDCC